MALREVIARNTAYNALGRVWEAVAGLVLVAYIVARVGIEQYGLWAIVAAFTGYASLFDLGIGSAYSRFVAEHNARGERERVSAVISTGLLYQIFFAIAFVAVAWLGVDALVWALRTWDGAGALGSPEVIAELRVLLRWSFVLFGLTGCLAPFASVPIGMQRMDVSNVLGAATSLVKIGATVFFLESGHGLRGLVYANAVVTGAFAVAAVVAAFVLCPWLRVAPWRASRTVFRRLFGFGWRTQVSRLANLITFETDVLIITFVLRDLQLAGLYKIGLELANKMRQAPVVMMSALIPAAAQLDAQQDGERLTRMYVRGTKYVAAVAIPLAAFVAGGAGLLMTAWQGGTAELGVAVGVLRVIAAGYLTNILPGPGVAVSLGMGRAEIQMYSGLISMVSNITLTIGLVFAFGFWGVPAGTVLSMALSWAWFARSMRGAIGVGAAMLWREALRGPAIAILVPLAVVAACDALSNGIDSRAAALGILVAVLPIFTGLYLGLLRLQANFDAADLDFLGNVLKLRRVPGFAAWARPLRQH